MPDGSIYSGKRGTPIGEFLKGLPESDDQLITGAVVNGELRELTYPIDMDSRVRPLTMHDTDGARIYRRSVTFLLEAAFEDLFPDTALTVVIPSPAVVISAKCSTGNRLTRQSSNDWKITCAKW